MKSFLAFIALSVGIQSFAATRILDCKVAKVYDDNVFEEGLSKDEYPDVTVDRVAEKKYEVSVGAMRNYETKAGDFIRVFRTNNQFHVTARYKGSRDYIVLRVAARPNSSGKIWGHLYHYESPDSKENDVALLICE